MADDLGTLFMFLVLLGWAISLRLAHENQRRLRDEFPDLFVERSDD